MELRAPIALAFTALLASDEARAQWQAHADLAAAAPLAGWQRERFTPGVCGSLGVTAQLARPVDIAATIAAVALPPAGSTDASQGIPDLTAGGLYALTAGLRLRPLSRGATGASRWWVQVEGGAGMTGGALAPVLRAGMGWSFSAGAAELGPFVGYTLALQTDPDAFPGDAHIATLGLRVSLPTVRAPRPRLPAQPPRLPPPPPRPAPACPTLAVSTVADVSGDGCPDPDRDGDAIADATDRCPDTPEDRDGFEDDDGCPEEDNDRDGIPDARDRCPNEPEVINAVDDEDGCPDTGLVVVREGRIILEERLFFDTDSFRIRARSRDALDAVATLLRRLPPTRILVIEGHADARGDARYNDMLSLLRARAVQEELVARGFAATRFRLMGFGRRAPVSAGNTPEALAQNRRVQIILSGVGTLGVAMVPGGWVRVEADGSRRRAQEPPR